MIREHNIIDNNIVIILDFNFDIGSFKKQNKTFKTLIEDYIKENNIDTFGKKILLVLSGIVLATFVFSNNNIQISSIDNNYVYTTYFSKIDNIPILEEKKELTNEVVLKENDTKQNKITVKKDSVSKSNTKSSSLKESNLKSPNNNKVGASSSKYLVVLYRSNGKVEKIDLEEYVIGVVAAEMPAGFNIEALKAQAILSRTYALKSKQTGKKLTDTVSTQAYIDINQMKSKWGNDFSKYYNKVKNAVEATKGMYITYNGSIIDAVYHSTSNGYTEDAVNVWGYSIPYLKTVESSWDKNVTSYKKVKEFKIQEVLNILGIISLENIEITNRNGSGRVSFVKIDENIYTGVDFRNLLSLRSADFDIEVIDDDIRITTRGYGHGVGMSQYGANEMAKKGYKYSDIIKHYYSGVKISNL